jgi:biopolymer transport protein TolR
MAFSMAGGGPSSPQINVTPLIDVLLVLLIIFMVVVTQQKEKGLSADIPQPARDQPVSATPIDRTIVVQLVGGVADQPPALTINNEPVTWAQLPQRLQAIFNARAERVAFIQGDDEISFQYVADVIDIAHNSGVDRVGLLDKEYERNMPAH